MKTNKIIIVDLEATCWEDKPFDYVVENTEIIEIGITQFNCTTNSIMESEGIFVKPDAEELSDYCTNLTTITYDMLAEAQNLDEAFQYIKEKYKPRNYLWGSWGFFDLQQMRRESLRKNIEMVFPEKNYINLKSYFALTQGLSKGGGLQAALKRLDMDFEGTQHRGIDDTINIARILKEIKIRLGK